MHGAFGGGGGRGGGGGEGGGNGSGDGGKAGGSDGDGDGGGGSGGGDAGDGGGGDGGGGDGGGSSGGGGDGAWKPITCRSSSVGFENAFTCTPAATPRRVVSKAAMVTRAASATAREGLMTLTSSMTLPADAVT